MGENSSASEEKTQKARNRMTNVYIWDMDETLILLKSLLNGAFAEAFNGSKDVKKGVELGRMWEDHILKMCDDYFFYEQVENYNKPFLDALKQYDDGLDLSGYDFNRDGFSPDDPCFKKLAYRFRAVGYKYKQGLQSIFDQEMLSFLDELYSMTDEYTDRWLSSALAFLEQCSSGEDNATSSFSSSSGITDCTIAKFQHVNILVTSGSLIPSLAKCLLFRLDNWIAHGDVYSSWEVGKLQCFQWVKERFNDPNVRFCVIGDGWEECEAAQAMQWPFVKIDLRPGSSHRFPGLSLKTIGYYFSVVYGNQDAENDEE
ncbi:eyes absent homolog [Mangifera indica]|uniref:eyes absent homolog n=1 Tax=Mangifera indica TaxID=29780 RepID=UPI001CFA46CF|nr:eyes absent homolog [Mangifera indica]